jgi:4-amino-4-deoxy-L-arabinose transferase
MSYYEYTHPNNWMLVSALTLYILSVTLFELLKDKRFSLITVFLGSISFFSYIAAAYPFLHIWDEQFHALVAKNLGDHFFYPTLLEDPIIEHSRSWVASHLWLHKQPFFLWQEAISMKLFGVNTFALRIPDILMSSLMPLLIYRIGRIIKSKTLGFYAGLLFLTSNFLMTLVSGRLNTDHNDLAFIFYVTASFWAWFEYKRSDNTKWLYVIGIFSGIAILVKWLVGLIVYAGWGLSIIADKKQRADLKQWTNMLKSMATTLLIALPWQIYILIRFPQESRFEYAYNTLHFSKVIEGHGGDWLFHIQQWALHIAPYFDYLIPLSLLVFIFLKIKKEYKIAIISWIFIVVLFYSMAATKMPGFTLILSGLFFIVLIAPFDEIIKQVQIRLPKLAQQYLIPIFRATLAMLAFYFMFSVETLLNDPAWRRDEWKINYTEKIVFEQIKKMDLGENARFYNFYFHGAVRFMFHTSYQAQRFLPSEKQIEILKSKGVSIYIFDNNELPDYILNDSSIIKIKSPIWRNSQIEDLEFYR